jgi:hypothetical protein
LFFQSIDVRMTSCGRGEGVKNRYFEQILKSIINCQIENKFDFWRNQILIILTKFSLYYLGLKTMMNSRLKSKKRGRGLLGFGKFFWWGYLELWENVGGVLLFYMCYCSFIIKFSKVFFIHPPPLWKGSFEFFNHVKTLNFLQNLRTTFFFVKFNLKSLLCKKKSIINFQIKSKINFNFVERRFLMILTKFCFFNQSLSLWTVVGGGGDQK